MKCAKGIAFLLLFLLTTVFASSVWAADTKATVEIRVAWWGDTKRHELYNRICDAFEAANPGIKLIREPVSWADYWDKMMVQSAGGNMPDFMGMHPQFVNDYVRRGMIEPLDKYIKNGTISIANMSKGAVDSGVIDGVDYMIPMGITGACYVYNKTLFDGMGLAVPSYDWTWNDLSAIGVKARAAFDTKGMKDSYLIADFIKTYTMFRYWVRQEGRDLYKPNGDIGFTADDAASWFAYWKGLQDKGVVPDAATSTEYDKATLENGLFAKQKIFVYGIPANQYKLYSLAVPNSSLVMVRTPSKVGGKPGEFTEGAHFAVSSKTTDAKKLAAAKLINFWVNAEASMAIFGLDQGVPANQKMAEFIKPKLDSYQVSIMDYVAKLAKTATFPAVFPPTGASEIDALFQATGEQVRFGAKAPQAAGKELVAAAQAIVEKNRKK